MWCTGEIQKELEWTFLVLIPKGTTTTWVIGLLKTLWMVLEALIDTHIKVSLYMHDILHRFRDRRGMGTSIMDFKFA